MTAADLIPAELVEAEEGWLAEERVPRLASVKRDCRVWAELVMARAVQRDHALGVPMMRRRVRRVEGHWGLVGRRAEDCSVAAELRVGVRLIVILPVGKGMVVGGRVIIGIIFFKAVRDWHVSRLATMLMGGRFADPIRNIYPTKAMLRPTRVTIPRCTKRAMRN